MNVVASSLGILVQPETLLAQLAAAQRDVVRTRSCCAGVLKVQDEYGFVFGTGLISNFLEEYYAKGDYGATRAIWLLLRSIVSEAFTGRYAKRIFVASRPGLCRRADPSWATLLGLGAATVSEVGLGFKLNHRADDHPGRFSVLGDSFITAGLDPGSVSGALGPRHLAPPRSVESCRHGCTGLSSSSGSIPDPWTSAISTERGGARCRGPSAPADRSRVKPSGDE